MKFDRMADIPFLLFLLFVVCLLLAGCGAGLEEPDPRPVLDVSGACPQQPNGVCDGPKVAG